MAVELDMLEGAAILVTRDGQVYGSILLWDRPALSSRDEMAILLIGHLVFATIHRRDRKASLLNYK